MIEGQNFGAEPTVYLGGVGRVMEPLPALDFGDNFIEALRGHLPARGCLRVPPAWPERPVHDALRLLSWG